MALRLSSLWCCAQYWSCSVNVNLFEHCIFGHSIEEIHQAIKNKINSCLQHSQFSLLTPILYDLFSVHATTVEGRGQKLKSQIAIDNELMELLHKDLAGDERIAAHEFFLTLAACNTVIPIPTSSASCTESGLHEYVGAINYQGESPDEQALVAAASAYGYTLFERTSGHIVIDVNGEKLR